MNTKVEIMAGAERIESAESVEQAKDRKRLERRWFWIAMLLFVGLYYNASVTPVYFEIVTDLHDTWIYGTGYALSGLGFLLLPLLFKRIGTLGDARRFRLIYSVISAIGLVAFASFSVLVTAFSDIPAAVFVCLEYISLCAGAVVAGLALHRAVGIISSKLAVTLSGLSVILLSIIATLHMVLLEAFGVLQFWVVSFTAVYAITLMVPLILLFLSKDNFSYTAPKHEAFFSDALFGKFIILAVLMLLMDALSDGTYYAGGDYDNIFGFGIQVMGILLPIIGAALITLLLRKNKWLPVMATVSLLFCFQQGLILFFNDNYSLAVAYSLTNHISSAGPAVFILFIPLIFCIQRRISAAAATGIIALWLIAQALPIFTQSELYTSISSVATPAVTFVLSLIAIAWLFYLSSENNRVYIASLIAEFKSRELASVQEAVSAADKMEDLGLSPREREVCALLLKSLSIKQISAEMSLAFSTVNGYYRSLYRKLGISSKGELFMRFGAEPSAEPTDLEKSITG